MMVIEEKIVPERYKMTELGEIPVEWEVRLIKEVADVISGGTPSKAVTEYWNEGTILWATPTDITRNNSKYIYETELSITELGLKKSSANLLPAGSILMTSRATIGERSIATAPISTNQGFKSFVCHDGLSNEYMYYYLEILKQYFLLNASGSTFLEVSKQVIENQVMAIPPHKEQQKIVEVLSTVDEQIENTEQLIEKTKELKKGLMQQLLTKGIGHTEFKVTEIGEIPVEWEAKKLEDLISDKVVISHIDGNHGSLYPRASEFVDRGTPYISANSIVSGSIDFSKAKYLSEERGNKFKKGVAKNEDVLFAHNATVGPVAILKTSAPKVILSTSLTLYRCDNNFLLPSYLSYYLDSPMFKIQYQKVMSQTTRNQVPITAQRKFLFLIPTIQEQEIIANTLGLVDERINYFTQEKERYTELKKGLMQQLLTGKIRV
ncbi:type I restriction modification system, subunit S [Bacillus sp. NRRL B-14911]|uniref:restriction endonuclease subunit S n=1 Tax=Bacillus sp. NRRL B-14911 TaxID=313627 RepID=UPI00006B5955|nr:restriction endonuclease subunit S [Bacillus sp. NRRL B-14911]EAR66117.1 type I restriction modification system, subunit S [Bacillus sp. NRRL B-14911]